MSKYRAIYSHADGKWYSSLRSYEKSLDRMGYSIMSEKEYKLLSERGHDMAHSEKPKPKTFNAVDINIANGKITLSNQDH